MILQCSHIDKAFSTDVILSDISFHINEHEKQPSSVQMVPANQHCLRSLQDIYPQTTVR